MYIINKCTGTSLSILPIEMYWYMCYNINKIREAENPKPQKGKKEYEYERGKHIKNRGQKIYALLRR